MRSKWDSWLRGLPNTLGMHIKSPEIDLETYRRTNRTQIALSILPKLRVYLDTMVWIRFRDISLGRLTDAAYAELYSLLRDACGRERVICPVSYSAISELLNQEDQKTRQATARVMDELSHAVCIEPPHHLIGTELEIFLYRNLLPSKPLPPAQDFAWTKVGNWVGQPTLVVEAFSSEQLLAMQKTIDDSLSSLSVEIVADRLPSERRRAWTKQSTDQLTTTLNEEKVKLANQHGTYREFLESEIWGALDGHQHTLEDVMARVARPTGFCGTATPEQRASAGRMLRALIGTAYKLRRIRNEIPQLHIGASLHALIRYDRKRKYKSTDMEDFHHAGSALPYCQVFLTERSLAHSLKNPPASLTEDYNCVVFSNPSEALEHIRALFAP